MNPFWIAFWWVVGVAGYLTCALIAARITLAHFVREDGTFDTREAPDIAASFAAIFWPAAAIGYGGYLFGKYVIVPLALPRAAQDRRARERLATKLKTERIAREALARRAREIDQEAKALAERHGMSYPSYNPFIDDAGTIQYNPVGRPPMSEGK